MCDHGPMLEKLLDSRLADLESQGLLRHAEDGREREAAWHNAQLLGVQFVDASSNDYLGLGCQLVSREMFDDAASGEVAIRDAPEGDSPGQLNQPGRPQAAESCLQERVSRETTLPLSMGAGASRLIHGTRAAHRQLERQLAHWVGLPDALLFSSLKLGRDSMSPATAMCFLLAAASIAMVSGWRWKSEHDAGRTNRRRQRRRSEQ